MKQFVLRSLIALFAYGCIFLLTLLLENTLRIESEIPGAIQLSLASFSLNNSEDVKVSLPHNWDKSFPNQGGIGRYHFQVKHQVKPNGSWAIYLPQLSMNASVSINGVNIGNGGSMVDPIARYWNLPLYFIVPESLWKEGDNFIDVYIAGYPNGRSGLSPIFAAPHYLLHKYYEKRKLTLILLDIGSFAINLILGVIILIWASQTKDLGLYFFGFGALISCIPIADSFWTDVELYRFIWRWITHCSLSIAIALFYLFMLKMLHRPLGLYGKCVMGYMGMVMIALLFTNNALLLPVAKWLHFGDLFLIVQLIYICISDWVKRGSSLSLWLGGCMFIVLNFGLADWLPAVLNQTKNSPYIYYIGPVAFSFAVSLALLARYISALSVERHYSENLQSELKAQKEMLDQQFKIIAELEKDRAVANERNRIMRELHDGIGGHLMAALALSEKKNISSHDDEIYFTQKRIRYALDELRLVMDSLDQSAEFETALAMLRQRIEPELLNHNIKLIWDIGESPPVFLGSPERILHGLRLIQEAIVNVLKHAQSTVIEVKLSGFELSIADNGVGFNVKEKSSGRGLHNIRWRAEQLQADLIIESTDKGSKISIVWPKYCDTTQ
jgi:signal transduction histidine kinase